MKKLVLISLYLGFVIVLLNTKSLNAIAGEPVSGHYVLASCGAKGVHLYVLADADDERAEKIQKGEIFLTWVDGSASTTDLVVFYDQLKLEIVSRGRLQLKGSVVLPPPLSDTIPIDLTITRGMDSGGRVGGQQVTCATTAFFETYH